MVANSWASSAVTGRGSAGGAGSWLQPSSIMTMIRTTAFRAAALPVSRGFTACRSDPRAGQPSAR